MTSDSSRSSQRKPSRPSSRSSKNRVSSHAAKKDSSSYSSYAKAKTGGQRKPRRDAPQGQSKDRQRYAGKSQGSSKAYSAKNHRQPSTSQKNTSGTKNILPDGVFLRKKYLYVTSHHPDRQERFDLFKRFGDDTYRQWDPKRSKLAAAVVHGLSQFPFKDKSKVLYLGASHGYTPSFLSDICHKGQIFSLDFAPRVVRDLVFMSEARPALFPMLADAKNPQSYSFLVPPCDVVFMDIAQKDQVKIFVKNCKMFLKPGGIGMLALKARSVDASKPSSTIFNAATKELSSQMQVLQSLRLDPEQKDHMFFLVRMQA